ncbi:DUF1194 domain-containing protein [Sagittula sp. M10.9X]|uniref:DUF1194 domain-containing protein n=2 Tax=Sagittula salina TaxID=2820268 RepID=A0A940MPQ5_9RHOB|nr:DUF1194 domain-containing protein [Sagittula salina]
MVLLGLAGAAGQAAQATCRQALALGLDVSGSVDDTEYRLQMDGLAAALMHPEVRAALFEMPDAPVSITVFEWSGPESQRVVVPWVAIDGPPALEGVAARLRGVARGASTSSTALGAAKRFGAGLLAEQVGCWKRVLDISGDGTSNTGVRPGLVRPDGITINGLVIEEGENLGARLEDYYTAYVVQGPDAFVERAAGFDSFEAAMVRKLKRELTVLVVSGR